MGELNFCNYFDIIQAVRLSLDTNITTDGGIPLLLVRILHNKVIDSLFFTLRCYFLYFDAYQLSVFISPLLYPFIIYAYIGKWQRIKIIFFTICMPIIFILVNSKIGLDNKILYYKLFFLLVALIGFVKLVIDIGQGNILKKKLIKKKKMKRNRR